MSALSLTVGGGRDVDFRDLPVEFVSRVEVVKTPTAEMTEGGIGTVRVITRKPFDDADGYLAGSVQGVYSDLADATDPKVALIGSKMFLDGTLGVLAVGAIRIAPYRQQQRAHHRAGCVVRPTATGAVRDARPWHGRQRRRNARLDPEIPRYIIDRRETTRTAFNGVVQWKPTDELLACYLDSTYARGQRGREQHAHAAHGVAPASSTTRIRRSARTTRSNHIEVTGSAAFPMDLAYRNINGQLEREQYNGILGVDWTTRRLEVRWTRATTRAAKFRTTRRIRPRRSSACRAPVIDYTGSEGAPNISFPGLDTTNGALVNQLAAVFNPRNNNQHEDRRRISTWSSSLRSRLAALRQDRRRATRSDHGEPAVSRARSI